MTKIKALLLCAVMIFAFAAVTLADGEVSEPEEVQLSCAAVGSAEYNSRDGFSFPSDAKPIGDDTRVPAFEGGKGGNIVEIGSKTYFRAIIPSGSEGFSATYDLTSKVKAKAKAQTDADGNALSDEETEKKDSIAIDGSAVIGIYVSAGSAIDTDIINASLVFTDEDRNSYVCRTEIYVNRPYTVIADTPDKVRFESVSLYLSGSVTYDKSLSVLTSLLHSSSSSDVSAVGNCELLSVISHSGKLTFEDSAFVLGTDTEEVTLSVIPKEDAKDDFEHTVFAFIECSEGEGSVSAVAADQGSAESSHAIFKDSGSVAVRASRTGDGSVRLRFRSAVGQKLTLSSVTCFSTDEKAATDGSFTTLTFKDGRLEAIGKISTDTVTEYQGATLGLFTKNTASAEDAVLLDEIKMTSRFSFSVPLDKFPHALTDNVFFVGIMTDEGTLPVTRERFVSAKSGALPPEDILGLHGANPISVFESGVSNILIDADLSKLIVPASASSITLSRNGFIYGVNTEYLRKLDSDVNFYGSIGVSVQIRYVCTEGMRSQADGSHLTYDGLFEDELMLRADRYESLNIYPAITSFLSQRYKNISSFVISSGVNSTSLTGINHDRLWKSVSDIALISRLVYSSASEHISGVTISVPIILSSDGTYASAEVFSALFGEKIMSAGDIPWCLVYTADSDSPSVLCENIKASLRLNGGSSPLSFTVIYEAMENDGNSTKSYESFCNTCSTSSVKQVFLSVENVGHVLSRESYSALKNYGNTKESFIFTGDAKSVESLDSLPVTGTAPLWDFSTTYSPEGWNAGYGIASLQSSSAFGADRSRVLRAITDTSSPAGIFLCSLKESVDLREAPFAEFVFDLEADDSAKVVFIFGNETNRAEFSLGDTDIYEKDGKKHAFCDLSDYAESAGSISYAGVIIYSEDSSTFELSRVDLHSTTLDSSSLAASLSPQAKEAEEKLSPELIIGGAAGVFVILCIAARITSVLAKQDAKNLAAAKPKKKRRF